MRWLVTRRPSERDTVITSDFARGESEPLIVVRPRESLGAKGRQDADLVACVIARALDALRTCEHCGRLVAGVPEHGLAPAKLCVECARVDADSIPALGPQPTERP